MRVFLQFDKIMVQLGEVFVALDHELTDSLLVFLAELLHNPLSIPSTSHLSWLRLENPPKPAMVRVIYRHLIENFLTDSRCDSCR